MTAPRGGRGGDRVRRVLAQLLSEELRDPRIGFVTLTDVKLSSDRRHAVAFVTILGEEQPGASLETLNRAAPFLRKMLAQRAGMRHTPALKFVTDEVVESGSRLERLFVQMREEWSQREEEP